MTPRTIIPATPGYWEIRNEIKYDNAVEAVPVVAWAAVENRPDAVLRPVVIDGANVAYSDDLAHDIDAGPISDIFIVHRTFLVYVPAKWDTERVVEQVLDPLGPHVDMIEMWRRRAARERATS